MARFLTLKSRALQVGRVSELVRCVRRAWLMDWL